MKTYTSLLLSLLIFILCGCQSKYADLPTYTPNQQLQAVIEIPAGNNRQLKYNRETNTFDPIQNSSLAEFLPYPANFGFIPSTEINANGKGLEILVISESVETGTVMEVLPLAVPQLETNGELRHIIVAIPARPSQRTVQATDFITFSEEYPAAKEILQHWFTNYNPANEIKFVGWKDELFAAKEIQRWMRL